MSTMGDKPSINHANMEAENEEKINTPEAIVTALDAAGGRPNPFGRGHIKLYLFCMIIYFCSTMNGRSDIFLLLVEA